MVVYNDVTTSYVRKYYKINSDAQRANAEGWKRQRYFSGGEQIETEKMCIRDRLYVDGYTIFATHGHIYNETNRPPLGRGDIPIHGHTHIPCAIEHEGLYLSLIHI